MALPLIASNDVRFLHREDFDAHEARVCIASGRVLDDPRRPRDYSPEQYLKSRGGNGRAVRRPAGSAGQHRRAGQALQPGALARHLLPARLPGAGRLHAGILDRGVGATRPAGTAAEARHGAGLRARRLRRAPGQRTESHRLDGLPRLLPDRCRLHQLGQAERHPGRPRPRLGRRLAGGLGAGHHRPRPDALRPAVRALPQSRARVDARLRHRLLHGPPRRGDRLRRAEVRPRQGQPDHHLRHHGGQGGGARQRPRARLSLRFRRSASPS